MRKKARIALTISLAVLLGVIAFTVLQAPKVPEPIYHGKGLGQWLDMGDPLANNAMLHVGTNAIPWLLQEAAFHEPWPESLLKELLSRQSIFKFHFIRNENHQNRAVRGFLNLGMAGALVVSEGLTNSDKWVRFGCVGQWEVGKQYPNIYITPLLRCLNDPEPMVRARAANALGLMDHQQSESIVPALINSLDDPDPDVRTMAALGLGCCGADAKVAVPAILKHLSNSTPDFRYWASNALSSIGPVTVSGQPSVAK